MTIRTLLALVILLLASTTHASEPLRVMTFNIRFGSASDGENSWPHRRGAVAQTIHRFDPDVLGVQEALAFQLDYLKSELPGYRVVGVGRDDGKRAGEHAALLLRESRFELESSGTVWLSDTPEAPGSIGWGAKIPRVYTWARVRDLKNQRTIHLVDMHWDHQSQQAREHSAEAILAHLKQQPANLPAIVMGDLNSGPENPALQNLVNAEAGLRDSFALANPGAARVFSFNDFRPKPEHQQIDWVLVSRQFTVESAGVETRKVEGRLPSDHFPVWAVLRLTDGE
ncbi:MAG: endonuclease/exonuclease/phosphatase family protein [Planctomycetales bacterium]|nr:endonuclease/exonuclease/phosphatase family protein [Planctomycetales bacterium]